MLPLAYVWNIKELDQKFSRHWGEKAEAKMR